VLPKGVQQGQTESGGIVLATICCSPSAQRRCHPQEALNLPFSRLLIVNKLFSPPPPCKPCKLRLRLSCQTKTSYTQPPRHPSDSRRTRCSTAAAQHRAPGRAPRRNRRASQWRTKIIFSPSVCQTLPGTAKKRTPARSGEMRARAHRTCATSNGLDALSLHHCRQTVAHRHTKRLGP
jgi:hypothetical protein